MLSSDYLSALPVGSLLPYARTDVRDLASTTIHVVRLRECLPDVSVQRRQRVSFDPYKLVHSNFIQLISFSLLSSRAKGIKSCHPFQHARHAIGQQTQEPIDSSAEGDEDENEEDEEDDNPEGRITKPAGEVGRPGRGGYNLQNKLNWPVTDFERVKARLTLNRSFDLTYY